VPGRFYAGIARVIKLKLFNKLRLKVQDSNSLLFESSALILHLTPVLKFDFLGKIIESTRLV
jgi:hypothetical protein